MTTVSKDAPAVTKSDSDQAYERLLAMIVDLTFAPGAFLNEQALAAQLELGRTPVREALARLSRDRFVSILPRRGVIIAPLTIDDVLDMFEARETIECGIAFIAATHVTESDVLLAQASNGVIIGFNVRVEPGAKRTAETATIDIRLYNIIYDVVEDVRKAIHGMLEPKFIEIQEGRAEIRAIFGKTSQVAGSMVLDGQISRGAVARITRQGKAVGEGKVDSLRRFKDDVREVQSGFECGIVLTTNVVLQPGDLISTYRRERVAGDIPL